MGRERHLAAAVHLNLAGPLALALLTLVADNADEAPGVALLLGLLWTAVDGVVWALARRMSSPAAFHAAQAFWWAVAAFAGFFLIALVSGGTPVLGFVVLAPFAAVGGLAAYRTFTGKNHRYPGVTSLVVGRR